MKLEESQNPFKSMKLEEAPLQIQEYGNQAKRRKIHSQPVAWNDLACIMHS